MVNGHEHPINAEAKSREEMIDIPESVRIRCPLVEFRLRSVEKHCPACPHFKGLADRFPDSKHRFVVRFAVMCAGEPTRRELMEVAEG